MGGGERHVHVKYECFFCCCVQIKQLHTNYIMLISNGHLMKEIKQCCWFKRASIGALHFILCVHFVSVVSGKIYNSHSMLPFFFVSVCVCIYELTSDYLNEKLICLLHFIEFMHTWQRRLARLHSTGNRLCVLIFLSFSCNGHGQRVGECESWLHFYLVALFYMKSIRRHAIFIILIIYPRCSQATVCVLVFLSVVIIDIFPEKF